MMEENNNDSSPLLSGETTTTSTPAAKQDLPWTLRILFSLNGFSLSLPMQALLYILNYRVAMPVPMIPTYSALAFLPHSLKPLYAQLSSNSTTTTQQRRSRLIGGLLIVCALLTAATAWASSLWIFIGMAFLRGVATAWPEFLLGLTLMDQARSVWCQQQQQGLQQREDGNSGNSSSCTESWESIAARLQAQAATARNMGSLVASLGGALVLSCFHWSAATTSVILLVTAGVCNLFGAVIALVYKVGDKGEERLTAITADEESTTTYESINHQQEGDPQNSPHSSSSSTFFILMFQALLVLLSLQMPIASASPIAWDSIAACIIACLFGAAYYSYPFLDKMNAHHSAGLYLLLKGAIPTTPMILSSYVYTLLKDAPGFVQSLYLIDSFIVSMASWSYGRWWSRYSRGSALLWKITGTTIAGSLASLGNLALLSDFGANGHAKLYLTIAVVKLATAFLQEWAFLPNMVIATIHSVGEAQRMPMRYGVLVSCHEAGTQISAILTGPLLLWLGVTRENDWAHLDSYIVLCAFLGILSVSLLAILR